MISSRNLQSRGMVEVAEEYGQCYTEISKRTNELYIGISTDQIHTRVIV